MIIVLSLLTLMQSNAYFMKKGLKAERRYSYKKALRFYKKGCSKNEKRACAAWGRFLLKGIAVKINRKTARAVLKKACKLNSGEACRKLYLLHNKKPKELILKGCKNDDAESCELVYRHSSTKNKNRWKKRAIKLYKKQCKKKDGEACSKVYDIMAVYGEDPGTGGGPEIINHEKIAKYQRRACKYGGVACGLIPVTVNGMRQFEIEREIQRIGIECERIEENKSTLESYLLRIKKWLVNNKWRGRKRLRKWRKKALRIKKQIKGLKRSLKKCRRATHRVENASTRLRKKLDRKEQVLENLKNKRMKKLSKQCRAGHATACLELGSIQVYSDKKAARTSFQKACKANAIKACVSLLKYYDDAKRAIVVKRSSAHRPLWLHKNKAFAVGDIYSISAMAPHANSLGNGINEATAWAIDKLIEKIYLHIAEKDPDWKSVMGTLYYNARRDMITKYKRAPRNTTLHKSAARLVRRRLKSMAKVLKIATGKDIVPTPGNSYFEIFLKKEKGIVTRFYKVWVKITIPQKTIKSLISLYSSQSTFEGVTVANVFPGLVWTFPNAIRGVFVLKVSPTSKLKQIMKSGYITTRIENMPIHAVKGITSIYQKLKLQKQKQNICTLNFTIKYWHPKRKQILTSLNSFNWRCPNTVRTRNIIKE